MLALTFTVLSWGEEKEVLRIDCNSLYASFLGFTLDPSFESSQFHILKSLYNTQPFKKLLQDNLVQWIHLHGPGFPQLAQTVRRSSYVLLSQLKKRC